jgi:hypothetical protein
MKSRMINQVQCAAVHDSADRFIWPALAATNPMRVSAKPYAPIQSHDDARGPASRWLQRQCEMQADDWLIRQSEAAVISKECALPRLIGDRGIGITG